MSLEIEIEQGREKNKQFCRVWKIALYSLQIEGRRERKREERRRGGRRETELERGKGQEKRAQLRSA